MTVARSILLKFESISVGVDEEGKDLVSACLCVCVHVCAGKGECVFQQWLLFL